MAKKKDLKEMVDEQLTGMMSASEEASEGRMKLLTIAIKKLALDAKLEESEFGDFFDDGNERVERVTGSTQGAGAKPATGKRANGGTESA